MICAGALIAQTPTATPVAPVEERRKALNDLFHEFWEASLKQSPEFASSLGDKRYNDKISDVSVKAVNEWLAREQGWMLKLGAIDPAGLSDQEKISRELLLRQFAEDQEAADFKEWEMPVNQMGGIHTEYPQVAALLSFTTVKDYDDWIARLHAIPKAFEQTMTNMSIGVDDKRVPPKYLLEKALEQVKQLAGQKAEESPLAMPLKNFPASITAAEQERIKTEMLDAIGKEVLPAYMRFARFLEVTYIPAGQTEPGLSALPDGAKYYKFLIRRTTTTDLTAEQIHQIGLDEVKRDEAEMLAIAQKLGFKDLKSFQASIKADPKQKAASREALLDAYRGYLGRCRPSCRNCLAGCRRRSLRWLRCRIFSRRLPRLPTTKTAHLTAAALAACASTPTMQPTAISMWLSPSRITKACPGITCKSPSRRNSRAFRPSANSAGTRHLWRDGDCTRSG